MRSLHERVRILMTNFNLSSYVVYTFLKYLLGVVGFLTVFLGKKCVQRDSCFEFLMVKVAQYSYHTRWSEIEDYKYYYDDCCITAMASLIAVMTEFKYEQGTSLDQKL